MPPLLNAYDLLEWYNRIVFWFLLFYAYLPMALLALAFQEEMSRL